MTIAQPALFNYTQLDTETRIVVQQRTEEIKVLVRRSAQDIIDIGNKLIDVKARLGHGNFGGWLDAEFGWSVPSAARFMQVAAKFGDVQIYQIDKFGASALYLLSAPSTPEPARIEAIERAQAGEAITHKIATAIATESKQAEQRINGNGTNGTNGHHKNYVAPQPTTLKRVLEPIDPIYEDEAEAYMEEEEAYDYSEDIDTRSCHDCKFFQANYPDAWCTALNRSMSEQEPIMFCQGDKWQDRYVFSIAIQDEPEEEIETVQPVIASAPVAEPAKMAIHFSSESPEHYTPKAIVDASIALMGSIDLDPCSNSKEKPNVPALDHYTADDDGLSQSWFGRIYMNPPYGRAIGDWVTKLKNEYEQGNVTEAIALVPARTDTQWWQAMRNYSVCFVTGRLTFIGNEDPAPFPSAIFYLGEDMEKFYSVFSEFGDIWTRVDENWFTQ